MDVSLNNYLESLIPNWNFDKHPLYRAEENRSEEQPINYLANKILSDMSQVSFDETQHQTEFMHQVYKLNTLIRAYHFIENTARKNGAPEGIVNELTDKEFTEYTRSLRRLGLKEEQFEDVSDEFQELSMVNDPKEHIYENQILKMVILAKAYLASKELDIDSVDNEGYTQFYRACMSGELEKIQILLSLDCDPNIPNAKGVTPFYYACRNGMTELVDYLIKEEDVDPNIEYNGRTPLYTACKFGFDEIVSIIAKSNRVDLNAAYNGVTSFIIAINSGNENCARILLEAGVDINAQFYSACSTGMTEIVTVLINREDVDPDVKYQDCPPIYVACDNGFDEIVSIIANSNKANLDAAYNGVTPFIIAISSGNENCARILLEAGVDINAQFYYACSTGMTEIVTVLINRDGVDPDVKHLDCPPLFTACELDFDEIVSIIVNGKKKVNLNAGYQGKTPFMIALDNGNENCARILMKAGVDINAQDESGYTLFHLAVLEKNLEKTKMLLSLGCNPNIPSAEGATPFYTACCNNATEIVDILINRGDVNPKIKCKDYPPLFIACEFGFDEIVSIIVKSGKVDLNTDYKGKTPFMIAIDSGNENCARILLEAGVDINAQFYLACLRGMTETVEILINRGDVDPNVKYEDCTPLYAACKLGFDEIVSLIVNSKKRVNLNATYKRITPFTRAINSGNEKCARILMQAGVDIDAQIKSGYTLFHLMVLGKKLEQTKLLLSLGCNPNIPEKKGATPFYSACYNGIIEMVDILINNENVDPNIKNQDCTPLYAACKLGFYEIVSLIAKSNRVDINAQDKYGNTLFHLAVDEKNLEKAKMLLSLGCDPNIPELDGYTPFYTACNEGMTEIVDMLVKSRKVDLNIKCMGCPPILTACDHGFDKVVLIIAKSKRANLNATYKGCTPLAKAIYNRHENCARILVEEGADITFDMNDSETPLLLAYEYGFYNIASIIEQKLQINTSLMGLDLHNIASVFYREKIELRKDFLFYRNYNFENLNKFLASLDEDDKRSIKKETLDSFSLSIVNSIRDGSFQEFRRFLDYGKNFYKNTIEYIINFLKLEFDETVVNIMQRYAQILQVEIEKEGNFKKLDKLKLAYLIEIEIPKIRYVSHKVFSQKDGQYPRTIIVEKGSQRMLILAKKQFSIISGKGGFKDVKSALLVPQDKSINVKRFVFAKIINRTKDGALEAQREYELIKYFSGSIGFGKAYRYFCFDQNGDYVNRQQLGNKRQEEEIRSALVLEEMDNDFHKVVRQLTLNEQVSVTKQLVEAINVMMRKEKVSWDLKLSNVLFSRDVQSNEVKVTITDLGLAHDIRQGVLTIKHGYGSPWYGAPELLYAKDVVNDANGYLKCEMWALGLIMYNMCFEKEFPLIDHKFIREYDQYRHLPVVERIAHYKLNYNEYEQNQNDLIEKPLKDLLLLQERTPKQNLEILTYSMLRLNRNIRMTPVDAEVFCRENF